MRLVRLALIDQYQHGLAITSALPIALSAASRVMALLMSFTVASVSTSKYEMGRARAWASITARSQALKSGAGSERMQRAVCRRAHDHPWPEYRSHDAAQIEARLFARHLEAVLAFGSDDRHLKNPGARESLEVVEVDRS